jgi:hypothetical protein
MVGEKPTFEPDEDMDMGSDEEFDWRDMWERSHKARFIAGEDYLFDYSVVDGNDEYDDWKEMGADAEDKWFAGDD